MFVPIACDPRLGVQRTGPPARPAVEHMLGFTSQEARGRYCFEMIGGSDENRCCVCRHGCPRHAQAMDHAVVPTRDLRVRSKPGRDLWINLTTLHAPVGANSRLALVHLFRDVSKQKARQHGMRRLLDAGSDGGADTGVREPETRPRRKAPTSREREVLRLPVTGASTTMIADALVVSRATARNHIHNMLSKLNAHSRVEAVAVAWRDGLL